MNPDPSRKADILIVDDVPDNLDLLAARLSEHNFYTRAAINGKLALMAARASTPDLILLDILMPEMDGYQVCQELKADPRLRDVPVIFVSALDETVDKVRAFQVGAADFISKPFQFAEVIARVNTHLTLYQQKREIQQQNDLKTRFLAMASHEFRTPITIIRSSLDILRLYADKITEEHRTKKYEDIDRQLSALNGLVDDILFYNQIETTSLEFHPEMIDLKAFCGELVQKFETLHRAHSLVYSFDDRLAFVNLDANLLDHALSNLLSNAFKYSPDGSRVFFTVSQHGDKIMFQVEDEGMGIPPDEQKNLFKPFYRASNAKSMIGTGLGLSIVKQFVELHSGKIQFESADKVGSIFTVMIPQH